jgi:hypothetical protein
VPRSTRDRSPAAAFDAITVEGALIAPALLARIAQHQADGQKDQDYAVPKGLTLRDEIARYFRIGQAMFRELTASETPSAAATITFAERLLRDVFGFSDIRRVGTRMVDGRELTITLEALGGRVPVLVVPPADDLDRPSDLLTTDGRRRSAASALQDCLNSGEAALWGLCTSGVQLRLVRDNASLTRPAYIEADVRRIFEADGFADFAALWLLVHASRFGAAGAPPTDCALERWRDDGQKLGRRALDDLSGGVEAGLLALGNGFVSHSDNGALRDRLQSGALSRTEFFGQLLRLVYRLIFLLAAEDRGLLHPPDSDTSARRLYSTGYSVGALRDVAVRRSAWDRHHDRWEGLLVTFAALARGETRLALPALGGLFEAETIPDLEGLRLANRHLMEAVFRLAWLRDAGGLTPVNWRDMETEELGSVYESLLELTPQLTDDGRAFAFAEGAEAQGHARKTTGSYYTPDSLVQALLDSALDPVLDRVEAEADDRAVALLSVTVIDPACGSGHFLLAAARRISARLAHVRSGGAASPDDYRHALRDVVRACIHGVDRNPMAIELAKVALWIETVEPGRPLGFLDANLRCGDSLLGVFDLTTLRLGVPDAAYRPLTGDDKEAAKYVERRNKAERVGQGTFDFGKGDGGLPTAAPLANAVRALRAMPEESVAEVAERRRRFQAALADPSGAQLRIAADLYVAAFLVPKTCDVAEDLNAGTIPTTTHVWDALGKHIHDSPLVIRAQELAAEARVFHWPLEFPDTIAAGGFDVVLGNPPWERIKLEEQEFFAAREPEIAAAPNAAMRSRMIAALKEASLGSRERALYDEFKAAKRAAESVSAFARVPGAEGGRFPLTGRGDVNTYALFTELFSRISSAKGRAGVIVPTGIATDATTAPFFSSLLVDRKLVSLHDFQTGHGYFDRIGHARFKFCLLTIGGTGVGRARPDFSFFSRTIDEFRDKRRHFTLSRDDISKINPNTLTVPIFRTSADAELTAKIYGRVPVLIDESRRPDGNPWGMSFMAMFHMSNDSGMFRTAAQLSKQGLIRENGYWDLPKGLRPYQSAFDLVGGGDNNNFLLVGGSVARETQQYIPLLEAKLVNFFDHRASSYSKDERGYRVLPSTSPENHASSAYEVEPFYWVTDHDVTERLASKNWTKRWLIGWRDITHATNERTLIPTLIPRWGVGNSMPLLLPEKGDAPRVCGLVANLSALCSDFVVRQKAGGLHMNIFYVKQLPVLPPSIYTPADLAFIVPRVLELTYTSHSMAPFARDLGFNGPPFVWNEDRRAILRAELDAWYARAYGLTRDELRYILDPTDVKGSDFPSETFRGLKTNEIQRFGEYRTAKLVLQAWDRLLSGEIAT